MAPGKEQEKNNSTLKALSVIRAIAQSDEPISLQDIARSTGFSLSVCHRFAVSLLEGNFIKRSDDNGGYILGSEMLYLGRRAQAQNPIRARIASLMRTVSEESSDTSILMVPDGRHAVCIERIEGSYPIQLGGTQIGTRTPLHCGGAPFALLAFSDEALMDDYLRGELVRRTPATATDPASIRQRIAEARRLGYSVGDEDLFEQVVAVGVPVFDHQGKLMAAISLGGVKQRYDAERIAWIGRLLLEATRSFARSW